MKGAKMGNRIIVNCISGLSASLRRGGTLEPFVKSILNNKRGVEFVSQYDYPTGNKCIKDGVNFVASNHGNKVLLIGKSMGGVKTWWMINKHWGHFERKLGIEENAKLGVVLIDPHGPQSGDGVIGSYGVRGRNLGYKSEWDRDDVKISVLYQKNKYPRGAMISGAPRTGNLRNIKVNTGTHWNMTRHGNDASEKCGSQIIEMIDWLCK